MTPTSCRVERIRALNDEFRAEGLSTGRWVITDGVAALGMELIALAVRRVRRFEGFDPAADPWGEHDFGAFDLAGERLFWKIEYYDPSLSCGSDDPADAAVTARVLTVMLACEYRRGGPPARRPNFPPQAPARRPLMRPTPYARSIAWGPEVGWRSSATLAGRTRSPTISSNRFSHTARARRFSLAYR